MQMAIPEIEFNVCSWQYQKYSLEQEINADSN